MYQVQTKVLGKYSNFKGGFYKWTDPYLEANEQRYCGILIRKGNLPYCYRTENGTVLDCSKVPSDDTNAIICVRYYYKYLEGIKDIIIKFPQDDSLSLNWEDMNPCRLSNFMQSQNCLRLMWKELPLKYSSFCYINLWLITKCQISLFLFLLLQFEFQFVKIEI